MEIKQIFENYSNLELIGISFLSYVSIKTLFSISRGFWTCFLGHKLGFGIKWKTGDNVWAVITGGTDGIGLEYAKQLAKIGYNLVIISRSEDKLRATAKTIKDNYSNCKQIRTIAVDFSRTDIYETIAKELNELEVIDVLVNNVGTLWKYPEYFCGISSEFNEQTINVNIISYVKLIEMVLPKMVDRSRGVIINISSQTALNPIPLMTTYSATKVFDQFLSEGIAYEYESKGVTVQTVLPSLTKTKMLQPGYESSFFVVGADDFASAAIKTVGIETTTYGHWKHKLMAYILGQLTALFGKKTLSRLSLKLMDQKRLEYLESNQQKID